MNPSLEEHKSIRPVTKTINGAANRADCAAEEVEEGLHGTEPENGGGETGTEPEGEGGEPDPSCGVLG